MISNNNENISKTEKKSLTSSATTTTSNNDGTKNETNLWDAGSDYQKNDISSIDNHNDEDRNDIEKDIHKNEEEIPIELRLEEFNENDQDMDPLEWTTRKLISIPKVYYWQTGNYDVATRTKVWHYSIYTLGTMTRCAEYIGNCIADMTGLNSSQYDYVTDTMTPEEWEISRRNLEARTESRRSLGSDREMKPTSLNRGGEVTMKRLDIELV